MSVAVEARLAPHSHVTVIGTEIQAVTSSGNEEEPNIDAKEAQDAEQTSVPRAKPKKTYSKEELFAFKESPSTKIRPPSLSDKYCNRDGIWDPELWHYSEESEKRSASPIDSKKRFLLDGIVLSPQGRSFARGCQVTSDKPAAGKQNWNSEKQERDGRNKGSGRVGRGWEPRERNSSQRGRVSPSGDTKYGRNTKYDGPGRRRAGSYDSQPEWFTHGPSSQQDTIELKGLDEKENRRKKRKKDTPEVQRRQSADDMFDENKKFDINEFFDLAESALPISGMFENQITSRFSQWFQNERRSRSGSFNASLSNSQSNSRRSSITDELAEIAGLTLSSPVRTPTPDPEFLFAPIVPASESYRKDDILDVLQDSEIDVQPLLDSVIPHKTVKGAVNLEDLESEEVKARDATKAEEKSKNEDVTKEQSTEAFNKLVETMKASGHLPEKPTPTIPDIPPHLLPRPPSSKSRSRTVSPSLNRSRSPSPLQLLQDVIRRAQSPVGFVGPTPHVPDPCVVSSFDAMRSGSPVADLFSSGNIARPLTPEELYGVPPVFNINAPDIFEFTASPTNVGFKPGTNRRPGFPRYATKSEANIESSSVATTVNSSGSKFTSAGYPVISQAFVPTSVLRKIHSDKHEQKSTEVKESKKSDEPSLTSEELPNKTSSYNHSVAPQRQPLFDVPTPLASSRSPPSDMSHSFPHNHRANLMSPKEFSSPKSTREPSDTITRPELLTPHHLPLPGSPTSMSPHSLPLPQSPLIQETPKRPSSASAMSTKQRLLTPRSLPLPQSPLVNGATGSGPSDGTSNFGIRPLPKAAAIHDNARPRGRNAANTQDTFRRPLDQSTRHNTSGNNLRRYPQGQLPFQVPISPGMMRQPLQPGIVPSPYNMNTANLGRSLNVHPTALALALRNQQYQMARAAAVAAATAAVNRPPTISPAQAAAAVLMLNQQRASASAAMHGLIPQVNPRMFQQPPLRPNLPPALQHQHHVVHRSEPSKENSLSKWFSDAVLNQSQSQTPAPGRGAKVLSVEELERHA